MITPLDSCYKQGGADMSRINSEFVPDYLNIVNAALNKETDRMPLYEHGISQKIMEQITGKKFHQLYGGSLNDKIEYFKNYCGFFKAMGYDTVSFECGLGGAMPDSGCLGQHKESVIHTYEDFLKYPWDSVPNRYFSMYNQSFEALREAMPAGMKAIGGVGYGIFESVQDVIGYMNLCYISTDDPVFYEALFRKVGDISYTVWKRFLELYGDIFCVMRFGDDLGFKSSTLLSPDDIRRHIIPQYTRIISLIHSYNKPFLLHSCGNIFEIMPDLIDTAKIDAKHSNEDQIADFCVWVEKYGDKIGNFGGIDTGVLCRLSLPEIREYIKNLLGRCEKRGGLAFSTGNTIPDYVPPDHYLEMVQTVREIRGDK
jgi:uroporphyrinogen decarboxylase